MLQARAGPTILPPTITMSYSFSKSAPISFGLEDVEAEVRARTNLDEAVGEALKTVFAHNLGKNRNTDIVFDFGYTVIIEQRSTVVIGRNRIQNSCEW